MKRWIHASIDDRCEGQVADPFHEGESLKGLSKEELYREYEDYVDKNAHPSFKRWVAYLRKNNLY